jgi:hypothetical protein
MRELPARQAWRNLDELNPHSRWKSVVRRAGQAALLAAGQARLSLDRERDRIFCIGSCFAKNIEARLIESGFRVVSHPRFRSPALTQFTALPNIFNVCSILNEVRWGLDDDSSPPEQAFVQDDQGYLYDPHSTVDAFRTPADVARTRRIGTTENMRQLKDCRVVVMTLGLAEVWFDRQAGQYLNCSLPRFLLLREPERYALCVLDHADCLGALEQIHQLLTRHGRPDVEMLISVSPVPLVATFTDEDVLTANGYSKAVQLAAVRDFASRHANVHYVPSYESVINSTRKLAWRGDLRHVQEAMVAQVIAGFLKDQNIDVPVLPAGVPIAPDWPADAFETEQIDELPKFFSSCPGDPAFPAGFPTVTASSMLSPQFDPHCLMSASKRIWHSQSPVRFPEWVELRFDTPLRVGRLFLQSQDRHPERSPGRFRLEVWHSDGWQPVLEVAQCHWRSGGGQWQVWPLARPLAARRFRLVVLGNAGDPGLVTLQNLYLEPATA